MPGTFKSQLAHRISLQYALPRFERDLLREEAKTEAKQVETKAPEKQSEQTTTPTAEALQAKCMELVRADRKNKQVIKDLLAAYSASLISDLDEAQRAELAVKLGAL